MTRAPQAVPEPAGAVAVKICGITRVADALAAVMLGADALGFVFWPRSPRAISPEEARLITATLPPFVATVGVFVNASFRDVLDIARTVPLSAVQFHGDEADQDVIAFPWRVLRAVALGAPGADARLARLPHSVTVLLDAHDRERRGGTGQVIDWSAAAAIAAERRVVLAGGLTPDNIGDAVRSVRPWGVDVSSGVEASPGIKDVAKLRALFDALGRCAAGSTPPAPAAVDHQTRTRAVAPARRFSAGGCARSERQATSDERRR